MIGFRKARSIKDSPTGLKSIKTKTTNTEPEAHRSDFKAERNARHEANQLHDQSS